MNFNNIQIIINHNKLNNNLYKNKNILMELIIKILFYI